MDKSYGLMARTGAGTPLIGPWFEPSVQIDRDAPSEGRFPVRIDRMVDRDALHGAQLARVGH